MPTEIGRVSPRTRANLRRRRHFGVPAYQWPMRMLATAKMDATTATSIHTDFVPPCSVEIVGLSNGLAQDP